MHAELTSLIKYLVVQGVPVSVRCLSSALCRSSKARLCSVALSISDSLRESVTSFHNRLKLKMAYFTNILLKEDNLKVTIIFFFFLVILFSSFSFQLSSQHAPAQIISNIYILLNHFAALSLRAQTGPLL